MSPFLLNLLDRVGWTAFQALGGVGVAGATATSLNVPVTDWRSWLVGVLVAAALCLLKVLGVHVAQLASSAATLKTLAGVPAVHNVLTLVEGKLHHNPAGEVALEVGQGIVAALGAPAPSVPVPVAVPVAAPAPVVAPPV